MTPSSGSAEPLRPPWSSPNPGRFQDSQSQFFDSVPGSARLSSASVQGDCRESVNARILSKKCPFTNRIACAGRSRASAMRRRQHAMSFRHLSLPIMQHWYLYELPLRRVLEVGSAPPISRPTTGFRIIGESPRWNKVNEKLPRNCRHRLFCPWLPGQPHQVCSPPSANSIGTKSALEPKQTTSVFRRRWKKGCSHEHTVAIRKACHALNPRTLGRPHPRSSGSLRRFQPLAGRGTG